MILALAFVAPAARASAFSDYTVLQRYSGLLEAKSFREYNDFNDPIGHNRHTLDIPQVEAEIELSLNPKSKIEFEVEYEHGGTGSAWEYDSNEEIGEFESEQDRGGDVEVEEIFYQRHLTSLTDILVGKAPVYFSFSSIQRKPLMYVAARPMQLEERMIPFDWAEPGVQLHQRFLDFTARVAVMAGLNSETFRTESWIGNGQQKQFENIEFNAPAYLASLEWGDVATGRGLAFTYYSNNPTPNRRLQDRVQVGNNIHLWNLMGAWTFWHFTAKAEWMHGEMANADVLANANGGLALPNTFNGDLSMGSAAALQTAELDYEFIPGWTAFARTGHVNTFERVTADTYKNPRYEVRQYGWGITHQWDDICAIKFEYDREWNRVPGLAKQGVYYLQFAFDTGDF